MSADLVAFLRAQIAEERLKAEEAQQEFPTPWEFSEWGWIEAANGQHITRAEDTGTGVIWGEHAGPHIARWDPARVLAECDAKEAILDEHAPYWQTVEWPHDQNGRGEAQVCCRCQNAEHTDWRPAIGEAGELPADFVAPYVLAPCRTLCLLALPYADRPDFRDEWRTT